MSGYKGSGGSSKVTLVAALALALSTSGCAEARQYSGLGMVMGGFGLAVYGAAVTPDRCGVSPSRNCPPEQINPGRPNVGIPFLLSGAVLGIAGGLLIVTALPHHTSGTIK